MSNPGYHSLRESERRLGENVTTEQFNQAYRPWLATESDEVPSLAVDQAVPKAALTAGSHTSGRNVGANNLAEVLCDEQIGIQSDGMGVYKNG